MFRDDTPPCLIYIDKEGRWFHKGAEMIHREFIQFFYEHMMMDTSGRYVIEWQGDRCYVDVEDTAFVVRRVTRENESSIVLTLSDDTREELNGDTLFVADKDVMYCLVKNRLFPARFTRPAYYQLAAHIEEGESGFFLILGGQRHKIRYEIR